MVKKQTTGFVLTRFMLPTSHYDEAKANHAIQFIENLSHTKGNGMDSGSSCLSGKKRLFVTSSE